MMKRISALLVSGVLLMSTAGCGLMPKKTIASEVYYNGYMGVEVTVPQGWYLTNKSDVNLSSDPADTADYEDLEIEYYDDGGGGGFVDLITLESKGTSKNDDHAEFSVYAEDYAEMFPTLEEYIEVCSEYYAGDLGENSFSTLMGVEYVTVNGVGYIRMMFAIENPANNAPYIEEHYVTQVGRLYMTVYINYWSDSAKSKNDALDMLGNNIKVIGANRESEAQQIAV